MCSSPTRHGTAMSDVTQILSQIESGDPSAAEQLLPLVYDELRKLAAAKLANEKPGQTLQATALVHDAYIRLVDVEKAQHWNSRGHFFAAAAEAMRRILIGNARRRQAQKRGGSIERADVVVALMDEDIRKKILALLDQHRIMTIATLRPDGWPQATTSMTVGSSQGTGRA